jgi:hypothetical protein
MQYLKKNSVTIIGGSNLLGNRQRYGRRKERERRR